MQRYLKEHQRDFMPEDTKAGMIQAYLDEYTGSMVCSKQLYKEALNHVFDEPKQWEIREINEIMNQCISVGVESQIRREAVLQLFHGQRAACGDMADFLSGALLQGFELEFPGDLLYFRRRNGILGCLR